MNTPVDTDRFLEGYDDVDGRGDPQGRIAYLDRIPSAATYKQQTFAMLDPRQGEHLLEVGCGTGADAFELARRIAPGGRVVGVDRSREMVAEARRRNRDQALPLEFCQGDVLALDFPDGSFDAVRCDRTLQHVEDPATAVAEMARVVRPGGRVVASEPDWDTLVLDAPELDHELSRRVAHHNCDLLRQGRCGRQLARLFTVAGLVVSDILPISVVLRDFELVDPMCRLSEAAETLVAAGELDTARGQAWLESQRHASSEGLFFAAMTGFCIRGTKP